ncbi:MAG: hypothetical protein EXR09_08020 [Acetobacteraceae bacterium]|nr:hypothetical protein [Acetobacteraceae bacterium]
MRRLLAGLMILVMIVQPAVAATRCAMPAEQSMFEIAALKSELMILAIACQRSDSYNSFVKRYRPVLLDLDKNLNAYFKRTRGARWQKAADDFTTDLVNMRSSAASHIGSDHCPRNVTLFSEVMALSDPADLPAYAAGKDLLLPTITTCRSGHPPAATTRSVTTRQASASRTSTTPVLSAAPQR